jgi:predicted HTH transcriptional regulator
LTQVVLVRGDEVLDSRTISMTPLGPQRVQEDDVTFDPPSRTESLEGQIAGGEGPTTEFKENLPQDLDKIPVTVSAFANTAGGAIFIGVDDHGTIKGIAPDRVARLADTVINRLRQKLQPFPPVRPETAVVGEQTILVLWVDAGPEAPFGVGDKPAAYYVRRGGNNFHATPHEIRALVRAHSAPPNPYFKIGL